MKTWFNSLSVSFKTALLSLIAVIVVFLIFIFGYFTQLPDLPNGILLGGLIGSLSYFILGIAEKVDEKKQRPLWTIIVTIIRFILILGAMVLVALLSYVWGYQIFNLFTVVGGYMAPLIINLIYFVAEKRNV